MTSQRRLAVVRSVLVLGLLCVAALPLAGQEEKPALAVRVDGFQVFCNLLEHFQLEPLADAASLSDVGPEETWIIAVGELNLADLHARFAGGLTGFLNRGGALLIASDTPDEGALRPWKLEIPGWKVLQNRESAYLGRFEECPMIVFGQKSKHPMFGESRRGIATNRPSFLRPRDSQLQTLAEFSRDTWTVLPFGNMFELRFDAPGPLIFLSGSPHDAPPAGRMAVLSNAGVFINRMLLNQDNDNFEFAWNTIKWFREGPNGKRRYVFFLQDGEAVTEFALPRGIRLPPELMFWVINKMLADMDKENLFNNLLFNSLGDEGVWRAVWIGLGALLFLLLLRRFVLSRFRPDTWVPLLVGRKPAPPPPLPVEWQRHLALEKLDNYWEPAQVLWRQFFQDHAGRMVPLWDEFDATGPPPILAQGNWWHRWTLSRQVRDLWHLAHMPPGRRLSRRKFLAALAVLAELQAAVKSGRLRLGPV
jgi:hypothetical protein